MHKSNRSKSVRSKSVASVASATSLVTLSIALVWGLAGCGSHGSGAATAATATNNSLNSQLNAQAIPTADGLKFSGLVTDDATAQDTFDLHAQNLMSSTLKVAPSSVMGHVGATGDNGSGVIFGGHVTLAQGTMAQGGTLAPTGLLEIQVKDIFPDHKNVTPLPRLKLTNVQGSIDGGIADITFTDTIGTVHINGNYNPQVFTGTFSYTVLKTGSGTPASGAEETLGTFKIPTCDFFACK